MGTDELMQRTSGRRTLTQTRLLMENHLSGAGGVVDARRRDATLPAEAERPGRTRCAPGAGARPRRFVALTARGSAPGFAWYGYRSLASP
jgi:hypothetical protein